MFRIGLSGLHAAAKDLEVTGNNIANSSTTGFKQSRAEFADVYSHAYGWINKTAVGSGVRLAATTQHFSQGSLEYTSNGLDLAINGEGFFVMSNGGALSYSRAGAFQVDRDGFVVDNSGLRLQAYAPNAEGVANPTFNTSKLTDMKLDFDGLSPSASTSAKAGVNLRSDAKQILDSSNNPVAFDPKNKDSYNYSTSVTLYDSLGVPRTTTMYFVKGANPLEWNVYTLMEGDPATTFTPTALTFDSNGKLVTPAAAVDISFPMATIDPTNGATIGEGGSNRVAFDFSSLTQYGKSYTLTEMSQDGYSAGDLSGFEVDQSGVLFARYTNGQSAALGQLALANFKNPQGLQQLGSNNWAETYASGEGVYDVPGSGSLGMVQSGALESSNVDLAEELVNLITAQRNYQANAKTITSADEVTQTIINIR